MLNQYVLCTHEWEKKKEKSYLQNNKRNIHLLGIVEDGCMKCWHWHMLTVRWEERFFCWCHLRTTSYDNIMLYVRTWLDSYAFLALISVRPDKIFVWKIKSTNFNIGHPIFRFHNSTIIWCLLIKCCTLNDLWWD